MISEVIGMGGQGGRREMSHGRWLDSVMDDIKGDRNGRARGGEINVSVKMAGQCDG